MLSDEQVTRFHSDGFVVIDDVLSRGDVDALLAALEGAERSGDRSAVGYAWADDRITTIHNIPLQPPPLSSLVSYRPIIDIVRTLVGGPVRVTGALLIDKDPTHNWAIGWHQDDGIYVERIPPGERDDVRGGLPVLTTKGMELARNVTCRVALDASTPDNGGLFVMPGSHRTNLGGNKDTLAGFAEQPGVAAVQAPGSVLFYAPLLLHRSEKSPASDSRRRVIHLQYGPADLELPGTHCYPFPQPVPIEPVDSLA